MSREVYMKQIFASSPLKLQKAINTWLSNTRQYFNHLEIKITGEQSAYVVYELARFIPKDELEEELNDVFYFEESLFD